MDGNNNTLSRTQDFHFVECEEILLHNETSSQISQELRMTHLIQCNLIVCVNLILMMILIKQKKLRKKKANKFFLNLQLVHVAICILEIIPGYHDAKVIVNNALLMEMLFSMSITTIDRFMAINYPFIYERMTNANVLAIIFSSWIFPAVFLCFAFVYNVDQRFCTILSTSLIASSTFILTLSNIRIYVIAKRHEKAIETLVMILQDENRKKSEKTKLSKSAYVSFSIVLSFIILWMPYFIHNILSLTAIYVPSHSKTFTKSVEHIALVNSFIDPILFIAFSKDIKKEFKKIAKMIQSEKSSRETTVRKLTCETTV